ncbi:MAG: methyl-accepting chemotaxis protein [Gammaproteobacteria bacterium]|nr:methyl-accepting chemotaxis protein [Gammaproteobacteria bacterium]
MASIQDSIKSDLPFEEIQKLSDAAEHGDGDQSSTAAIGAFEDASNNNQGSTLVRNVPLLVTMLVACIAAVAVFQIMEVRRGVTEARGLDLFSSVGVLSQKVAKDAREAVLGDRDAFAELAQSADNIQGFVEALTDGDSAANVKPVPARLDHLRVSVQEIWQKMRIDVDQILANEQAVLQTRGSVPEINHLSTRLLARSDEVAELLLRNSASAEQIDTVGTLRTLSQRIAQNVNLYVLGGGESELAASKIAKDLKLSSAAAEELSRLPIHELQPKLKEVDATFAELSDRLRQLQDSIPEFLAAQGAADTIVANSDQLLVAVQSMGDEYIQRPQKTITAWLPWLFVAVAVLLALLLARALILRVRMRAEVSSEQNRQTQDAILKLLDEMTSLADGDLTIEAEVTDQITGAIADSINFAIREMRALVQSINYASTQIAKETSNAQGAAQTLSQASEQQSKEIRAMTERIREVANSMATMSQNARRSSEVAEGSTQVAKRGAQAVRNTIRGMDGIREQIQETSKRIKRLGESSQQIGEVAALIEELADQTNVLSLNAAIQAATAGESGKGFAVVADEVQRLAERSAEATKQIADLINNIQTDTNEAVTSMERATGEVVEGSRVADAAGKALHEIETVSHELSQLIQAMADTASRQSEEADALSGQMGNVQQVAKDTGAGIQQAADSIGRLADLAQKLERSVAGFKLP